MCLVMLHNGVRAASACCVRQLAPLLNWLAFVQLMSAPDHGHYIEHISTHEALTAPSGVLLQHVCFMPRLHSAIVPIMGSSTALRSGSECLIR